MKSLLIIGSTDSIVNTLQKKITMVCPSSTTAKMYSYLYDIGERMPETSSIGPLQGYYNLEINLPQATRNIKITQPKSISEITKCQDIINFIQDNKIELVIIPGIIFESKRNRCYDNLIDILNTSYETEVMSLYI